VQPETNRKESQLLWAAYPATHAHRHGEKRGFFPVGTATNAQGEKAVERLSHRNRKVTFSATDISWKAIFPKKNPMFREHPAIAKDAVANRALSASL
jgi:hypothetical protein